MSTDVTLAPTEFIRITVVSWYSVSVMMYPVITPLGLSGGSQETTANVSVCRVHAMLDTGPGAVERKIRRNF